jgi:8-oxo-dGTP diphosphatase
MMNDAHEINYHAPGSVSLEDLTYVIIGTRENNKWIFVRHEERESWELPAGHIEENESAEAAARRELFEETGTRRSVMHALYDYTVKSNGSHLHGRLFLAEVLERGPKPDSEIAEIKISSSSPQPATYPEAHRSFLTVLDKIVRERGI